VSRWSDIRDTLAVARDAAEDRKPWLAVKLVCDVAPDFRYVKRRARKEHPRPHFETEGDYDEYDEDGDERYVEPEPLVDQRRRIAAEWKRIDWHAWIRGWSGTGIGILDIASYSDILRDHYSSETVEALATRPSFAAQLTKATELARAGLPAVPGGDGYEMRVGSYANLMRRAWKVVLPADVEDDAEVQP
jgi:hypothetical protein